jgi:peptidoglycan/xylan/chitin deacetylase (PgdA/CDA1 family)
MLSQFLLPLLVACTVLLVVLLLVYFTRRTRIGGTWRLLTSRPILFGVLTVILLALVPLLTLQNVESKSRAIRERTQREVQSANNLLPNPDLLNDRLRDVKIPGWKFVGEPNATLGAREVMTSPILPVRPEQPYRYSFLAHTSGLAGQAGGVQLRILWYGPTLDLLNWHDSREWRGQGQSLRETLFAVDVQSPPPGSSFAQLVFTSLGPGDVRLSSLQFSSLGVHVEPHPNAARASIAFSFDWESAMGGLIHSKGGYNKEEAERRGLRMRAGADWLADLFEERKIRATFYANGYNLISGNRERRQFVGDPLYDWANTRNGWDSDYWQGHRWFGDDPYGDVVSHPAWYFGDQTRELYDGGHEIASHTFGHLYVRGTEPQELTADTEEWVRVAKEQGLPTPVTFAFPWRSSNSLTSDFYDVLYKQGIKGVTRVYERDIRDLYTLYSVPAYPAMRLMPDFLLGASSGEASENAGGDLIGLDEGLNVIREAIARRGTTSFWTHPEELSDEPDLLLNRMAWSTVVEEAAKQRDAGVVWIAPVAEIMEYQSRVDHVSVRIERPFLGGWKLVLSNGSGQDIEGVTLTMPGDVARATGTDMLFVRTNGNLNEGSHGEITLTDVQDTPSRQLVIKSLKPGTTEISIEWAPGQEPLE